MKNAELYNFQDVLDSRDVIDRIEELEDLGNDISEDEAEELKALVALSEECSGLPDWQYGATLIRDSYWVEYCQELCEDIGDIPRNLPSYIEIDWKATAKNLEVDYTTVNFAGVEYYVRNC